MVSGCLQRIGRLMRQTSGFGPDVRGVSALEFAMIMPIMLALFFGGIELGDAFAIKRKVTRATSALSDLVTQARTISDKDMTNILDASQAIVAPYALAALHIKITGVEIDKKGVARASWSDARNDKPHQVGAKVVVPPGLQLKDSFLVMAELTYKYKPRIGYLLTGTFDLADQFYLRPRKSSEIKRVVR